MAFLSGAAIGAVLGILYAPAKGSHTREKLSFRLDKYKKMLEQFLDDLVTGKETTFWPWDFASEVSGVSFPVTKSSRNCSSIFLYLSRRKESFSRV